MSIGKQVIWIWVIIILVFVVTVAIIHGIDFHDIPFAKIISLSHDRVAALL